MKFIVKSCFMAILAIMVLGKSAAGAAPVAVKPDEAFRQAFPQVKLDAIKPTDIKGVYEVHSGQNVYYYYQEADYIIVGDIYQKDGKNLTAERRGELAVKLVKTLPLDKAVKIGEGKKVVIEITDPDCPYCRTASTYLAKKTDVVRYVFFAPLAHPAAINKVHYILGADNKPHAYEEMMQGKEIPKSAPAPGGEVKALAQEHLALAKKIGVRATPTFFINGQMLVGGDVKKLEQLLAY